MALTEGAGVGLLSPGAGGGPFNGDGEGVDAVGTGEATGESECFQWFAWANGCGRGNRGRVELS